MDTLCWYVAREMGMGATAVQQELPLLLSPQNIITMTLAGVKPKAAVIHSKVGAAWQSSDGELDVLCFYCEKGGDGSVPRN